MDFLCTAGIEEFGGFTKLGAADDGIIDEEQTLALDEIVNGDELHVGNLIADLLIGRHEGTGPGRGVLDERTGEWDALLVGIAYSVGSTGVGDTGNDVDIYIVAAGQ